MKQSGNQILIYKIHSTRLRKCKWKLTLPTNVASKNDEIISLSSSTTLRMLDDINSLKDVDKNIKEIRRSIKKARRKPTSKATKDEIRKLYLELYKIQVRPDYVCIIMDKVSDYYRANKGFKINGIQYIQLFGTTGGIKNSTIIYVNKDIYKTLMDKIDNGRDKNKPMVPAKLQAYMALSCSASLPVSTPKGILVVNDAETKFIEDIIKLDDTNYNEPEMNLIEDAEVELADSDGYGLILPEQMEIWMNEVGEDYISSGVCVRNGFCKGMLFTFDFLDFAKQFSDTNSVEDAWGNLIDIREVKIILTTSMLKLWNSYKNIDHYLKCCKENGYTFSITKIAPEKLEEERNMNYQFLQTLRLNDEKIDNLIQPTIDEIKDVLGGDYRKALIFLKGMELNQDEDITSTDYDFIQALMIDNRLIDDPFVKSKIHHFVKKRINDAKTGVIKVRGNFSIISGDPFLLCQSIFKLELTGLLKKGEFYNKHWNDLEVKEVAGFRAPMTCHNNIRKLNLCNSKDAQYWYKYMKTVTIFNAWDSTAHALNGADKDADQVMTTDCQYILESLEELPTIMCIQRTAEKKVVETSDFVEANIKAFGDEIGSTTNRITSMVEVQSKFEKDTIEYQTLEYRIACGQLFQQNAIDKAKGIECKNMPKEWYDYSTNKIEDSDSEKVKKKKGFNQSILADKKPYFMIYIYPQEKFKYNKFIADTNKKCIREFRLTLEELIQKPKKNVKEKKFIDSYYYWMPVGIGKCHVNKIAWKIEKEFDGFISKVKLDSEFDYNILKSDTEYQANTYNQIKKLYDEYCKKVQEYMQLSKKNRSDKDEIKVGREILKESFKVDSQKICPNEDELCNIVLDICYMKNSSKQFAWDISGETIIKNLLDKNHNIYNYPVRDSNGEIEYGGSKFTMISKDYTEKDDE